MSDSLVLEIQRLSFPWQTDDPFLFCVHHRDAFPRGNEEMGPDASLEGRQIGSDFAGKDGWSMYHGDKVPGFPGHPHRGFETVTVARQGFIDHSDSLGATARFGQGDVQWMTAGKGVVHSEMFPLVDRESPNTGELFQIWLNLPSKDKFADPHFAMLWNESIPVVTVGEGPRAVVRVIAGRFGDATPPPPPPNSWATVPEHAVAIWSIHLDEGASVELPVAPDGTRRSVYVFGNEGLDIGAHTVPTGHRAQVRVDAPVALRAANGATEALVLQGRPIGEPVAQMGPFVMNDRRQLEQAYLEYQRTGFGGWPWDRPDPVHPRDAGRFAVHVDGRREEPPGAA